GAVDGLALLRLREVPRLDAGVEGLRRRATSEGQQGEYRHRRESPPTTPHLRVLLLLIHEDLRVCNVPPRDGLDAGGYIEVASSLGRFRGDRGHGAHARRPAGERGAAAHRLRRRPPC